jgi:hypothetical protein
MVVSGKVSPAVENASIDIKVGDQAISTVKTDSEGNYKYGPVEVKDYLVFAHKEDFIFEKIASNKFDFKSSQLAKLEV